MTCWPAGPRVWLVLLLLGLSRHAGALAQPDAQPRVYGHTKVVRPKLKQRSSFIAEHTERIRAKYLKALEDKQGRPKTVVFTCIPGHWCGGLGDRIKGLVSIFYFALLTQSFFHIKWSMPVELNHYFTPPRLVPDKWREGAPEPFMMRNVSWNWVDWHSHPNLLDGLRSQYFQKDMEPYDVVHIHANAALWDYLMTNHHLFSEAFDYKLERLSKRQLFEVAMDILFSEPTAPLEGYVRRYLGDMVFGKEMPVLVGLQVRTGGDGEWGDATRHPVASGACFAREALRVCQKGVPTGSECAIFVTSDSYKATEVIKQTVGNATGSIKVYTTEGPIKHVDRSDITTYTTYRRSMLGASLQSREEMVQAYLKTYGDWLLLTQMDYLVISQSGYGETAAWFRNVPSIKMYNDTECLFVATEVPQGTS